MAWQTPKTDWEATDIWDWESYNRLVDNVKAIKTLASDIFDIPLDDMGSAKNISSIPIFKEINAIEDNLERINDYLYQLNIGKKKTYKANVFAPDYNEVNRLENITYELYTRLTEQLDDNTAPTITITSDYGDWATSEYYTVQGNVQPNGNGISDVYIYYTEYAEDKKTKLTLGQDGSFEIRIRLMPGTNTFTVRASDLSNNPSYVTFNKYSDVTAPTLTLTSANGYVTSANYTLTGTVVDNDSGIQSVTVNGIAVTVTSGGSFSYPKTISPGVSTVFTVVATDNAGNISTAKRTVIYDASPHSVPLTDALIKNISTNHAHNHSNGKDWSNTGTVYKYYILSDTTGTYTGSGLWAKAEAWYSGTIDLTQLPNYQDIKRVVVTLIGYGTQTINVATGQTSVAFSDYNEFDTSNSYFPHGAGERWGVSTKAGITSVTYYYT